jgi:hypothetical protein
MKKLKFAVLAGMVLLSLGMVSCASTPKLDLSTVDFSKPMSIGMIYWSCIVENSKIFPENAVNGELSNDFLLSALCSAVADNREYIEQQFKAKTGITITLNGDEFQQELKDGNIRGILSQKTKLLGSVFWDYQWRITNHENPDAIIVVWERDGKLFPAVVSIDNHDPMGNTESRATVDLR